MRFSKSHEGGASGNTFSLSQSLSIARQNETRPKDPSDWKKILLITGLGTLSWISTYTGMLELIQANMGEIGITYKLAIAFAVAMLMLMIIWLLDSLFARLSLPVRVLFTVGYIFLTIISIGFGFGFYWKFLESRAEATRSAESAVTNVQSALLSAQTRLEQLQITLATLTTLSQTKATEEREKGTSCPNSRPGDGPRRRLRDTDAKNFQFAGDFVSTRVDNVKNDISVLSKDLKLVSSRHKSTIDAKTGTRNQFLRGLNQKLNYSVVRFNAFRTDPQLRQFRNTFAERSSQTIFPNGQGGKFTCPDPQLQAALRGVVLAIDQLPQLEKPHIAAVEGSEAIIEAFRRLTVTIMGAVTFKMPPSPDELRTLQQRAVQSVENIALQRQIMSRQAGLGDRDYIPLSIAVFVDFCLLLVSMTRPMHGFRELEKKMYEAEEWPIIQILARFKDIHSDEDIRQTFEIFRHVVFDYMGDYYVGVPLKVPANTVNRENAQLEAHLLGNLFTSFEKEGVFKRVVWPSNAIARNRLEKQDSKFAGSEAFRIYRFRDGAWSDWVLGAIMGAAKRVEAEKQRQLLEEQLYPTREPGFATERASANDDRQAHINDEPGRGHGPELGQTGYTNVEPLRPSPARHHQTASDEIHDGRTGPGGTLRTSDYELHSDIKANGTEGNLKARLNGHINQAPAYSATEADLSTRTGTSDTSEIHSLWNDEPQADIIQLSDASSYISTPRSGANPRTAPSPMATEEIALEANPKNEVQTYAASNDEGTIRLRRDTVEFDTNAVKSIKTSSNGSDFMSALTDALNPENRNGDDETAAIKKVKTPEMPAISTSSEQGDVKSVEAYIHPEQPKINTQPIREYGFDDNSGSRNTADEQIQLEENQASEFTEYWEYDEEEDLQIENISNWFSRRDPDSKLS